MNVWRIFWGITKVLTIWDLEALESRNPKFVYAFADTPHYGLESSMLV